MNELGPLSRSKDSGKSTSTLSKPKDCYVYLFNDLLIVADKR